MEQKTSLKIIAGTFGTMFILLFVIITMVPSLNGLFAVEVSEKSELPVTQTVLPGKPEALSVTAYYQMEEKSKKISAIYIEVYHTGENTVSYLEIPADTKAALSEELYKSLQTYAPELPQYFKLSNMAEAFSEAYALTGCNRILSELLGVSVTDYVRADKEAMEEWFLAQREKLTERKFFDAYSDWLEKSSSGNTTEERWMYYESRKEVCKVLTELAPGSREKDGYVLSGKRSGERLGEMMIPQANK